MKRKISLVVFIVIALPLLVFFVFPWAKSLGGVLIYSILGVPEIKEAKLFLVSQGSRFITTQDTIPVSLKVQATAPVNLVSGTVDFSKDFLEVISISQDESAVNLWIRNPALDRDTGRIDFGGGIQQEGGFRGEGVVFGITLKPKKPGVALVGIPTGSVLAHDGQGTELLGEKKGLAYLIRDPKQPSPDFNKDGSLGISDVGILLFNLARSYNPAYDLNQDGRVNFTDVNMLRFFLNASKTQG